jgi:DNA (cytosine-5)-methyltransferase 1
MNDKRICKQVVLSLFPGADLFGKAFEERGFCVVRGPELLLGQDIRDFHAPAGRFDGVIGGPPCVRDSVCHNRNQNPNAKDLIPEFVRVENEAAPTWAVMEGVEGSKGNPALRNWIHHTVYDWDCGGLTKRKRTFWFYPQELGMSVILPARKSGLRKKALPTLLASDGHRVLKEDDWEHYGHPGIKIHKAAQVQGFDGWGKKLHKPDYITRRLGVHLLGNGVPRAMGLWVADQVVRWILRGEK